MSNEQAKIILPSSAEAAQYRTNISGWVSRDGNYYGDDPSAERVARYAGSTHSECKRCGATCDKHWTACDACRQLDKIERYKAMPRAAWDGSAMLYSEARNKYFNDIGDAQDDLYEGQTLADLMLVLCEPNYPRLLDEDFFCDEMSEDGDLPNALLEAIDAFNKVASAQEALSWSPGKVALLIDTGEAA